MVKKQKNKIKEECCAKYWEEHKNQILAVTHKYDLYKLEPLEEIYNERILLQNKEGEKFCYKYKLLKIWDYKNEKHGFFILFKSPNSSKYEFQQFNCMNDFKLWVKTKIEQEIKAIGLDSAVTGGAVEESYIRVEDGHWMKKQEKEND